MQTARYSRRMMAWFVSASCALHAVIILCVPIGPLREPMGQAMLRELRVQGVKFVKVIQPAPKPQPEARAVRQPAPRRYVRRRVRRVHHALRPAPPRPEEARPKPVEPRPTEPPPPLEARVLPPPEPEEEPPTPQVADAPVTEAKPDSPEPPKMIPQPEQLAAIRPEPQPTADTSQMVAMPPQPVDQGPKASTITVRGPLQPGRKVESTDKPAKPSAPDVGNPEVTHPARASGGDPKLAPQIGLASGTENRPALPGAAHRVGVSENLAGPGGPVPVRVNPSPGGSPGGSPRVAMLPGAASGPVVRRGVAQGLMDAPPTASRERGGPMAKLAPRAEEPLGRRTASASNAGTGQPPGPAARGSSPVALMTSPRSANVASPPGAGGRDAAGRWGSGEIVLGGVGGLEALLAGGPGGGVGGPLGAGYGKTAPALGSPWGGDGGEPLLARSGGGGKGGGGGGRGTGEGPGVGPGSGPGVGTGVGDGAGPGSGLGRPLVVAVTGPGGGLGYGDSSLPLGFPDGTTTGGLPGFPWLQPGLGQAGGGGEGFGGPHGTGFGGGYPGIGSKLTPGFGGEPGSAGVDIPAPRLAGGGGGGGADLPGGPGLYGPLQVGGGPGGGIEGLVASAGRAIGLPSILPGLASPLAGMHALAGGPGGGVGGGSGDKQAPRGIYADLVGTFDLPVGVTDSDYNTDEVSVLNLLGVMRERTNVKVTITNRYVPLQYDAIKDAPLLWISGHKPFSWTPAEREALRKYVEDGGTILAEDCHGPFGEVFQEEVRRIFGQELDPVPLGDDLFRSFYVMDKLPPGDVRERLPIKGLRTKDGRLGVIYSPNDYSDAWKVPHGSYVPEEGKEQAYRIGINMYVYILAHWKQQGTGERGPGTPGGAGGGLLPTGPR